VLFEKNDVSGACAANTNALAQATADEVELQNQIQYQGQRCASYNASRPSSSTTDSASTKPLSAPVTKTVTPPAAASSTAQVSQRSIAPVEKAAAVDSSVGQRSTPAPVPQSVARPKPPVDARDAKPSIVDRPKIAPTSPKTTSTHAATAYSVQVAAYNKRSEAEKLAASLGKRGYAARVDGDAAPFRVRIGRYTSQSDAESALARIKAKHMEGFVVRAPER
jgi:cell division protein FtsN